VRCHFVFLVWVRMRYTEDQDERKRMEGSDKTKQNKTKIAFLAPNTTKDEKKGIIIKTAVRKAANDDVYLIIGSLNGLRILAP